MSTHESENERSDEERVDDNPRSDSQVPGDPVGAAGASLGPPEGSEEPAPAPEDADAGDETAIKTPTLDADENVVHKALRKLRRSPGTAKLRLGRTTEWIYLRAEELKTANPALSQQGAEEAAGRELIALRRTREGKALLRAFELLAPSSFCPERKELDPDVEIAAALWQGPVRWVRELLCRATNARGFAANRSLVVAVFLQMAFGKGRPEVAQTRRALDRGHTLLSWAHDYPTGGPKKSQFYESLRGTLTENPPEALIHANVEMLRQLAELRDETGALKHPDIGRYLIVDGKGVEAEARQQSYDQDDPKSRMLVLRPGQAVAKKCGYSDSDDTPWKFWVGYTLCVLVDMASTLPVCWCLMPAGRELEAVPLMLEMLFEAWPECPAEALVGDSLYDHSKALSRSLVFDWGIQPVFVQHGAYRSSLPHVETDGVPHCPCGAMKLAGSTDWYGAERRAREGIARGVAAPRIDARLRWVCPTAAGHKNQYTRPHDDARLYTWFPRAGQHPRALQRQVLLLRRNAVESVFASLQELGLAGKDSDRPAWAEDEEVCWLLSAAFMSITARRLAHETGTYKLALDEVRELGLMQQPSLSEPAPGPDDVALAEARSARAAILGPELEPRNWNGGRGHGVVLGDPVGESRSGTAWAA